MNPCLTLLPRGGALAIPAILVVEDSPETLILLHRLLRDLSNGAYDIIMAPNGAAALAQLAGRHVPLLITDYNMPDMDGLQLAAAVKQHSPHTHIIMLTADHSNALAERALGATVDTFFTKPLLLTNLVQVIQSVIA